MSSSPRGVKGVMERIVNLQGKEVKVHITEGKEAEEYALILDFDGQASMSSRGYMAGGDFTIYSMTPEALVNLAMGIIEITAHAKAARELELVKQPIKSGNTGEAIGVGS